MNAALALPASCFGFCSPLAEEDRDHPILDNEEHPEHPVVAFERFWEEGECPDEERRREAEALAWMLALRFMGRLVEFLVGDGRSKVSKVEGAGIRAFVVAWFFSPRLKRLSQGQLAALMNRKHKQSVGREASNFRDCFGKVMKPGMQSEAARAACRRREAVKREVAVEFAKEGAADFVPEIQGGAK